MDYGALLESPPPVSGVVNGQLVNGYVCFNQSPDWEIWPNYEVV